MSGEGLRRVSQSDPCPVCGKPDWCLRSDDGSRAICARIESNRRAGEAGWLHVFGGGRRSWPRVPSVVRSDRRAETAHLGAVAAAFRRSDGSDGLPHLANHLGLKVESLSRLAVGWNGWAWTFPMQDQPGSVIGVRLRKRDGSKLALKGSREGLFIPIGVDLSGRLLVLEGPTDTAAALDLGLDAVGRPSCNGGVRLLSRLVQRHHPTEVVVFADRDAPGERGARSLALALAPYCSVRTCAPPPPFKDLRDWVRGGASRVAVLGVIEAASPLRVVVRGAR